MSGILLHLLPNTLAAALYALLGFHFWRTRWSETDRQPLAQPMARWERVAIGGTLAIHGAGLYAGLFSAGAMHFSFSLALSLMLWLAVFIYWLESFRSRMDGLQPMVLPLAAACALLPEVFPASHVLTHTGTWGFHLHFIAAMLAYSLFTLSALHAVFMGYIERKLHQRSLTRSLASLPPLLTMEALLFRVITVGFVLLTAALVSGSFFSEEIFGKALTLDHKILFAFVSWGIFAALLVGRHARGWRGRTALRWTVAGFIVLLLAYVGSRFVLEVVISRAGG
jgi:ABC-type uncharacterized transport system permease subunit